MVLGVELPGEVLQRRHEFFTLLQPMSYGRPCGDCNVKTEKVTYRELLCICVGSAHNALRSPHIASGIIIRFEGY